MAEKEKAAHECVLCNNLLESKESLQEHFRKHANKEIDCKSTLSRTRLQKKVIKKESPEIKRGKTNAVACDVCGQEFTTNTLAIQHKFRKHPEVSVKYICPYCGMQFTIKALFENHVKTHSSDTRKKSSILCKECGAEFYFDTAKDYHYKSTHERVKTLFQPIVTAPPSKKIKINIAGEIQSVYYCHLCGSEYVVKFNLQTHLEKLHSEEERCTVPNDLIRCTVCDALFYNQKAYETHNMGHKSDDLYVTSEQQRLDIFIIKNHQSVEKCFMFWANGLQTVSRVDQDFDIRRVLPVANKYLPSFKHKAKTLSESDIKKEDGSDDELSPPSSPDSSDSETADNKTVLIHKENTKTKATTDSAPKTI